METEELLDSLAACGYDRFESEIVYRRHASVYIWRTYNRKDGRAFGGDSFVEALGKAATWARQNPLPPLPDDWKN